MASDHDGSCTEWTKQLHPIEATDSLNELPGMKARSQNKSLRANRPATKATSKNRVVEKGNPRTGEGVGHRRIGGTADHGATEKQNQ